MWMIVWMGLGAMLATGGADQAAAPRPPLSVALHADNGSLPPPHRRSTEVHIDATGQARYTYLVGYDREDPQRRYEETFLVPPVAHAELDALLDREAVFDTTWQETPRRPVGGPMTLLSFARDDRQVRIPPFPIEPQQEAARSLAAAVLTLLPAEILERRRRWEAGHDEQ